MFQTGGQLVAGDQVMIGGHPVGKVDGLDLDNEGRAVVDVSIDQQLHDGTTAVIRDERGRPVSHVWRIGVVTPAAAPFDEQTISDRDQTASDADQTSSDHDQSASDRGPAKRGRGSASC